MADLCSLCGRKIGLFDLPQNIGEVSPICPKCYQKLQSYIENYRATVVNEDLQSMVQMYDELKQGIQKSDFSSHNTALLTAAVEQLYQADVARVSESTGMTL